MGLEEQDILLSAYLDGELEPELAAKVEEDLESSPQLQERLHQMAMMGEKIRERLNQEADTQDFSSMRAAVMEEVQTQQSARSFESEETWVERSIESLRQLFRQPAMSFALGAVVVLVGWMVLQKVQSPDGGLGQPDISAQMPLRSQDTSLTAAAGEQTPDLVVDQLEARQGTIELRTRPDDPNAPTVLWYVADGGVE
jgi:anti-sigma factor RsiW